jgi:hypothetical protein
MGRRGMDGGMTYMMNGVYVAAVRKVRLIKIELSCLWGMRVEVLRAKGCSSLMRVLKVRKKARVWVGLNAIVVECCVWGLGVVEYGWSRWIGSKSGDWFVGREEIVALMFWL